MPKRVGTDSKLFKEWVDKIELAKRMRKEAGEVKWKANIKLFNNQNWKTSGVGTADEQILINRIRSTVSFLRDATYMREPKVEISAEPDDDAIESIGADGQLIEVDEQAELSEAIVNRLFRRLRVKKIGRKVLLDGALTPIGWVKVYHETETVSAIPEMEQVTFEDHVVQRINPFNMIVDPEVDCFDMTQVRWLGEKKSMSKKAVIDNYKDAEGLEVSLVKDKLKTDATAFKDDEQRDKMNAQTKEQFDRIIVWEIHDRENNMLLEISPANGILRKEDPHPYEVTGISGLGFIYVPITLSEEDPENFYPRPYVEDLVPINDAINALATYFKSHVGRAAKRNPLVKAGAFDDPNQLVTAPDMEVIEIRDREIDNPVIIAPVPEIPEDAWKFNDYLFGPVYREISRIDESSRGGVTPGTSPTEATLVSQGTGVGLDAKQDSVGDFLTDIARILLANAMQFTSKKQAIRLAGTTGVKWRSWTGEDIKGNYGITVQAFSTAPFNEQFETRRTVDAVNILYGKPEVDNVELLSALVERMKLPERIVRRTTRQGPQDPSTEHIMLIRGIPLRVDPTEDHVDHHNQHQVFVEWITFQQQANPGNQDLSSMLQQLTAHIDQHRAAMVQLNQPAQTANAAIGSSGQPSQDITQDRGALSPAGPGSPANAQAQGLAGLVGGG